MPYPKALPTLTVSLIILSIGAAPAFSADAPRPWGLDQFTPLTVERIAALPIAEQPAWRAYLITSNERLHKMSPGLDLVDHSLASPSDGPPIPSKHSSGVRLNAADEWYASDEARTIADHVVNWQTVGGGWVKTGDYSRDRTPADDNHDAWSAGTFDNDSTINEMRYLAYVISAAGDNPRAKSWRESFMRGVDYIFAAQYPNGGFPQVYPLVGWYHDNITFNDDAMAHILQILRDISGHSPEFAFVPETICMEAGRRVERGIQCVLASQMKNAEGHLTVWGQQLDALTMKPAAARNFEPISECSSESARLAQFLMTVPNPSPEIVASVDGAVQWFQRTAIHGMAQNRNDTQGSGLVAREGAPDIWARYYEIGTDKPVFGDRDRTVHYVFGELSNERRLGYAWYQNNASAALRQYADWRPQVTAAQAAAKTAPPAAKAN